MPYSAFSFCESLRIVEFDENPNLAIHSICKALYRDPFPIILVPAFEFLLLNTTKQSNFSHLEIVEKIENFNFFLRV